MTRKQLIDRIKEICPAFDDEELQEMSTDELQEQLDELSDDSDMYPNGRDTEAEDEDM